MWAGKWKGKAKMKFLGQFDTVQTFWSLFSCHPPDSLTDQSHLHVFKTGVAPIWEDPHNASGGYIKITAATPAVSYKMWHLLVLNMIGEQFPVDLTINGTTIIMHQSGNNILKVWLPSIERHVVAKTTEFISRILDQSYYVEPLYFIPHKLVMNSSKHVTVPHHPPGSVGPESGMGANVYRAPPIPPAPSAPRVSSAPDYGLGSPTHERSAPPKSPRPPPATPPRKSFSPEALVLLGKLLPWKSIKAAQ